MNRNLWLFVGAITVIAMTAQDCQSQVGFRLETDLFVGDSNEPAQQTLSLFYDGVGYDISRDEEAEIVMVDHARDRIVQIHTAHKIQTEVPISKLAGLMDSARNQLAQTELAVYLKGAAQIQSSKDKVSVGDDQLLYEASMQSPPDETMAADYLRFADALASLNAWRSGGVPPFARLALNRAIAENQSVPDEITRTTSNGKRQQVVRCRVLSTWMLSKDDKKRIAEIGKMLVTFDVVSNDEYQKRLDEAARIASR